MANDLGLTYAWAAWEHAVAKGYIEDAVLRNVGEECFNVLAGGLVGVIAAVGGVMVCTGAGAAAGAAIGGYFSAGNPAAAYATAELGATIGKTIAETALLAFGIYSVVSYVGDHVWEIGRLAIAAYDIAVNQLWCVAGDLYNTLLDLAARWFAEAVGMFCGLLVFAIATLVMARVAQAKGADGKTRAQTVKDLFDSKLNDICKGLVQWIVPRAQDQRYKYQPSGKVKFAVIHGGIGPEQTGMLQRTLMITKRVMPKLVNPQTKLVKVKNILELDQILRQEGFQLTAVQEFGPPGGKQLFYQRGNLCVRIKTMGDRGGPRANTPHISMGVNDGLGTAWYNDLAKVGADGRLTFKAQTTAEGFKPIDHDGNPQRFISILGGKTKGNPTEINDSWGQNCHFNLDTAFSLTGLDVLARTVTP
jgi:hypothetical protein